MDFSGSRDRFSYKYPVRNASSFLISNSRLLYTKEYYPCINMSLSSVDFEPFLWDLFFHGHHFRMHHGLLPLKKDGRGWHEHVFDLGITIAFVGIIGGRLWDVFFFDWDYYHDHLLEIPYVWQGGMAIQGGVIFACVAAYFYLKKAQDTSPALC